MRSPSDVLAWARSAGGQKVIKYSAVSVISTVFSQLTFILVYGVFSISSRDSSITATIAGTVPSYYLNRNWAWGKSGRSHFWKEVAPFWIVALIGLVFSTWAVDFSKTHTASVHSHLVHTVILDAVYLGSFAVLWVAKFLIFNRFLFIDHGRSTDPGAAEEGAGVTTGA